MSCLVTIAETTSDSDISHLIDLVDGLGAVKKNLIIVNTNINLTLPQNRTLNFNVIIEQKGTGINKAYST